MYDVAQLYERGWTNGSIHALLGVDDLDKITTCMWKRNEIQQLEQTAVWHLWCRDKTQNRKERRKSRAKIRIDAKIKRAINTPITVKLCMRKDIEQNTIKTRSRLGLDNSAYTLTGEIPHKWMVNYIRHELTNYDILVGQLASYEKENSITYYIIRYNALVKIGDMYAYLRDSCLEQLQQLPLTKIAEYMPTAKNRVVALYLNQWEN